MLGGQVPAVPLPPIKMHHPSVGKGASPLG